MFGAGSLDGLPGEVERLGAEKALLLSTPRGRAQAEVVAGRLGGRSAGIYDKAVMHVPIETARAAREAAKRLGADCCIALGGGSTIGLGKAIAMESGLPVIAVPTTYAGSEMTPVWGLTEDGVKRTGRDPRVLPKTVLYDPALTVSLPAAVSGTSGMNAIAHCVEALYAAEANPVSSLIAEEGVRSLARSLPAVIARPHDLAARSEALYGACLAGAALAVAGVALHHKLCHTLGGSFGLPHAEVHTAVLPHAAAYNSAAAPEAMARVALALGSGDAPGGLYDLAASLGASMALKDLGLREADLDAAAEIATRNPYANPRPVTREDLRALLDDACHGRRPR